MTRRAHLPILVFLAAALFLRSLVPAGWMPTADGGALAIQPCPAADFGPAPAMGHHHHSSHDQHDSDCAFSPLLSGYAPFASAALIAAPIAEPRQDPARPETAFFTTGPPAPPPPPTGPPAIA